MGVLRAGKEPREHIWLGAAHRGSASSHEPPAAPQWGSHLLGTSQGTESSWLAGQPLFPMLRRLQGAAGTGAGTGMGCKGRAQSTAGTSCIGKATKRLICKINAAKPILAEPNRGGNLSTGCVVLWAGTRA